MSTDQISDEAVIAAAGAMVRLGRERRRVDGPMPTRGEEARACIEAYLAYHKPAHALDHAQNAAFKLTRRSAEDQMRHCLENIRDEAATKPNGGAYAAGVATLCLATLPARSPAPATTGDGAHEAWFCHTCKRPVPSQPTTSGDGVPVAFQVLVKHPNGERWCNLPEDWSEAEHVEGYTYRALYAEPRSPAGTEEAAYDRSKTDPVAWIAFADNGNIRLWTADEGRANDEKARGLDLRAFTLAELIALVSRLSQAEAQVESARAKAIADCAAHIEHCGWRYSSQGFDIADSIRNLDAPVVEKMTEADLLRGLEPLLQHEPRCDCGHLFEICDGPNRQSHPSTNRQSTEAGK